MATQEVQKHPANAVFLLLEDRQFRLSVVKPGLEKERHRLGRLVTGKYQVRGFRNISKAPVSMLLPVVADEANVSAELARVLLMHWFESQSELKGKVSARLQEEGYTPNPVLFDDEGSISWNLLTNEHANQQFDGEFLPEEDENSVMLMSLLLGWFGTGDEEPTEEQPDESPEQPKKAKPVTGPKTTVSKKSGETKAAPAAKSAAKKTAPKAKKETVTDDAAAPKKSSSGSKKTAPGGKAADKKPASKAKPKK